MPTGGLLSHESTVTVTGTWDLDASPFATVDQGSVPIHVELEDLGGGLVDVRSSWQGIPVIAFGRLRGNVLRVGVDTPRVASGVVMAYFDGEKVSGTADGTYASGRRRLPGKGVFTGARSSGIVGSTGYAGVDSLAGYLQRSIGAVYPTPDTLRAGAAAILAVIGCLVLMLVWRLGRAGRVGRAVVAEGRRPLTRVLTGAKAAGHLLYYEYLSVTEDELLEPTGKLAAFDPGVPAKEDGVRGVRYETIQVGERTLVAVRSLILIVQVG